MRTKDEGRGREQCKERGEEELKEGRGRGERQRRGLGKQESGPRATHRPALRHGARARQLLRAPHQLLVVLRGRYGGVSGPRQNTAPCRRRDTLRNSTRHAQFRSHAPAPRPWGGTALQGHSEAIRAHFANFTDGMKTRGLRARHGTAVRAGGGATRCRSSAPKHQSLVRLGLTGWSGFYK